MFQSDRMDARSQRKDTFAAAAAKSLQLCLTLCHPTDGSPPASPLLLGFSARTLEWVAISFSNAWKWKVKVKSLSHVRLVVTPWIAAYQAPLSMRFSRQEYWVACRCLLRKIPLELWKNHLVYNFFFFFTNQVIIKNDQNEIIFRSACAEEFISHFTFSEKNKQTKKT